MRFLVKLAIALVGWNFLPPGKASPQVVPAGQSFQCTPTLVWDGDGPIWCAEGPRIRIAGVAAREIDGSCRPGQPIGELDMMIAAHSLSAGASLVTNNVRHFQRIEAPLTLVNWLE